MLLAGSEDSSSAKKERLNDRASAVDLRTAAHAAPWLCLPGSAR